MYDQRYWIFFKYTKVLSIKDRTAESHASNRLMISPTAVFEQSCNVQERDM